MIDRVHKAYEMIDTSNSRKEQEEAFNIAHKYDTLIAKYLFTDVKEMDVTSNGETLQIGFNFPNVELEDWKDV